LWSVPKKPPQPWERILVAAPCAYPTLDDLDPGKLHETAGKIQQFHDLVEVVNLSFLESGNKFGMYCEL